MIKKGKVRCRATDMGLRKKEKAGKTQRAMGRSLA